MDSVGPGRTKVCTSYMDEVRGSLLKPPQLCRLSLRATQGARAARSQDQKSGNGLGGGGDWSGSGGDGTRFLCSPASSLDPSTTFCPSPGDTYKLNAAIR